MDMKTTIKSQYLAALAMLEQAIRACPPELWHNPAYKNQFWHTAYHALFYTHFYLHPKMEDFIPWKKHRDEYTSLQNQQDSGQPGISRDEVLEFLAFCQAQVGKMVDVLDLDAPSGFHWLPFNKLALQFYNIRHLQQHAGELYERLGTGAGIELGWIGSVTEGE